MKTIAKCKSSIFGTTPISIYKIGIKSHLGRHSSFSSVKDFPQKKDKIHCQMGVMPAT